MKIALLIILTLSIKQTISELSDNNSINVTLESLKEVFKEVKGEHMVKHIYTAEDGKQITGIKVCNSPVSEVMNNKSNNYISSVEVYRSNRREEIYLIKLSIKTDSDDVIIYLYEFGSGWRIVKMGFVHYIIGKLERGEKFEYPIYSTYQKELEKHEKEGTSFTSSATGTDVNIKFEVVGAGNSSATDRIVTVADKVKLKLYSYCGNAKRSFNCHSR